MFSRATLPAALLAAACGGASATGPAPVATPVESSPIVAVPAPAASAEKPLAPEPPAASVEPAPRPAPAPNDDPVLVLPDGPPGTWTGEHGNLPLPVREVWGAGDVVFVVTGRGMLQSNDRGLTWRRALLPDDVDAGTVGGASADEIWVGSKNRILRSTDRGATWKTSLVSMNVHYNGFWVDDRDVYAVGSNGVIVHSSDRGATWERQAETLGLHWLYGVWGQGRDVWAFGNAESWGSKTALVHTKDRGKTWTLVNINAAPLRGICGTSDGVMHVIDTIGSLHQSKDRGKTWAKVHSFGSMELSALACRGKSELFVGGRNRTFQHSEDGGKTWTDELAAQNKWTKLAFSMVDSIFALPSGEVFVGGEGVYEPSPTGTLFRRR